MKSERFESVVLSGHKEDAVEVPFDPAERWAIAAQPLKPGRRGYVVKGKLNGSQFESAVVSRSKKFWLLLPAEVEHAAGVAVGDTVTIEIAPGN